MNYVAALHLDDVALVAARQLGEGFQCHPLHGRALSTKRELGKGFAVDEEQQQFAFDTPESSGAEKGRSPQVW